MVPCKKSLSFYILFRADHEALSGYHVVPPAGGGPLGQESETACSHAYPWFEKAPE